MDNTFTRILRGCRAGDPTASFPKTTSELQPLPIEGIF